MGDVPLPPEPEDTRVDRIVDAATIAGATTGRTVRTALTGNPKGRIRRTILFILAAAGLGTAPLTALTIVGLIALMLLALTDAYMDA